MAKPQKSVPRTINQHVLIETFDIEENNDERITIYVLSNNTKTYYTDKNSLEAERLGKALGVL